MNNRCVRTLPTTDRLRELFHVRDDGVLVRNISDPEGRTKAGDIAGSLNSEGYLCTRIDGGKYLNHRIVWAMIHGEWPSERIDHINGVRTDNSPGNLRLINAAENTHNRGRNSNNKTGFRGVSFSKIRASFVAQITVKGKYHYLGYFTTAEEASQAYEAKAKELHGEFYRHQENDHG